MPEIGRMSLGKYTLLIRYELPTSDRLVLFSVMLNRFHTSSPANVNRKYDGPRGRAPATTPNAKFSTPAATIGCRTTHAMPSTVCR